MQVFDRELHSAKVSSASETEEVSSGDTATGQNRTHKDIANTQSPGFRKKVYDTFSKSRSSWYEPDRYEGGERPRFTGAVYSASSSSSSSVAKLTFFGPLSAMRFDLRIVVPAWSPSLSACVLDPACGCVIGAATFSFTVGLAPCVLPRVRKYDTARTPSQNETHFVRTARTPFLSSAFSAFLGRV